MFFKKGIIHLRAENIFLLFSIVFGFLFAVITPPFQVPDEVNHLYRAYQVSDGKFISIKQNGRVGGYVPESLVLFAESFKKLPYNPYSKVNGDYIRATKNIKLQEDKVVFKDFPNTAYYSPVSYIPQAITIRILRYADCSPYYLLYVTRLITLGFWILVVFMAIRMMPFQTWLLAFLALLPMSLSVNSSISADVVTNGLSFLFIAYALNLAIVRNEFLKRDMVILSLLIVLLASAKLVYVVLVFLFLFIPVSRLTSLKNYLFVFTIILFLGFGSAFLAKKNIDKIYTSSANYNKEYIEDATIGHQADMTKQMDYIMENKILTIKHFILSFGHEFWYMTKSYIGLLGWADTPLPDWFIAINYGVIFFLAIFAFNEQKKITARQKSILLGVAILAIFLIMLSQYLTWVPVGGNRVYPLQGRYFIPVFPLVFLIFGNNKRWIHDTYIRIVFILFFLFSGLFSTSKLYSRFYFNYSLEKQWEVFRDIDISGTNDIFIVQKNDTIAISKAVEVSDENAYSGQFSVKLTQNHPYGFSHAIYNAQKGDRIVVSVWCYGRAGKIVFSEFVENGIYYENSRAYIREASGWRYIECEFFVPRDMIGNELRVYAWNDTSEEIYLDDFKITYNRRK